MSRSFHPVPARALVLVFVAVAAATWTFSAGSLPSWMPPLWVETNAIPRDALLLVGPIVAGVGAWIGSFRHTAAIGALAARGWLHIASAQLAPAAASVLLGSTAGMVPAVVRTASRSTAGQIDPLIVLSGWLATAVLLAGGHALGVAWPNRIATVVAVIGAFVAVAAPSWLNSAFAGDIDAGTAGTSFYSVAFVWLDFGAGPGQHEVLAATLQRLLFFAALFGAVLIATGRLGSPELERQRLGVMVPFLVPMAIGAVMIYKQPDLVLPSATPDACAAVAGSEVCVPRDVQATLPAFAAGVHRIIDTFGHGALSERDLDTAPLSDYVFVGVAESEDLLELEAAIAVARAVAGMGVCETLAAGDDDISQGGALAESYSRSADLAYVLAFKVGVPRSELDGRMFVTDHDAIQSLSQLDDTQIRAFLDNHTDALRNCRLTTLSGGA